MELHHIREITDPLVKVIKDDPVRPHIPLEQRVNDAAEILILKAGEEILAATCMQWLEDIPADEADLTEMEHKKDVAVFYTIWSYSPGAGQALLKQAASWLLEEYKDIKGIMVWGALLKRPSLTPAGKSGEDSTLAARPAPSAKPEQPAEKPSAPQEFDLDGAEFPLKTE